MLSPVVRAEPFSREKNLELAADFYRDGIVLVPEVLTPGEVAGLKERLDRIFADPRALTTDTFVGERCLVRLFEWDVMFRDMLVREPIISLVETILGDDCHLIANGCVRNEPGWAFDFFHIDDVLWFPLPDEIPRFDPRIKMPCFTLNAQHPLTSLESVEYGPMEYVPGSHYSGREPPDAKEVSFEGRSSVPILCNAGDIYLQHAQVWHRGMPNTSDRTRYVIQQIYSRRFVSQRFYPFLNYRMPDHVLEGADERLLRILGKHPKATYG